MQELSHVSQAHQIMRVQVLTVPVFLYSCIPRSFNNLC